MLRGSLHHKLSHLKYVSQRQFAAAAATSAQKRALNKQQLEGTKTTPPVDPPSGGEAPPSSGSGALPFVAVGAMAAAGIAYYFSQQQPAPPSEVPKPAQKPTPAAAPSQPKSASIDGNRVTMINVPAKMKNASSSIVKGPEHPSEGNRVASLVPIKQTKPTSIKDSSTTESAIQKLKSSETDEAAAALIASHQSTWSEMDRTYFADLDQLSTSQLKARIVQLATEMKDRTKWEAVRLKEFLAMKEKETADQYADAMQKQRLAFEDLLAKRLREQEYELSTQMHRAITEKEATIENVMKTALEAQQAEHDEDKKVFEELLKAEAKVKLENEYADKLQKYKEEMTKQMQQKASTVEKLSKRLGELESALTASQANQQGSAKAHRLSAAALALSEKLETSQGAASELETLKTAAGKDGVIVTAVKTIPSSVTKGVPTLAELQARFEKSYKKFRQAALVPEGRPQLEGQLAGMIFAAVKYPPAPEDAAPENDKDSAEFVLVRARQYVQEGQLERAVEQLEKLKGQVAFVVKDWKKDAVDRIVVERALKVIKMECALLNEKLAE